MKEAAVKQAKVVVVDDNEGNVLVLEALLARWGCSQVTSTTDSSTAVALCERIEPDILLLDLQMPTPDGFQVMEMLEARMKAEVPLPVLVLTGDVSLEVKRRALSMGAADFLTKPFDPVEVRSRVANLVKTRLLQKELTSHNAILEERVRERTGDFERAELEVLERLARAAEFRDDDTGEHTQRVGHTVGLLAEGMLLPAPTVRLLRLAAPLHDVGKIGVPDGVLLKPGKLTSEEFEVMKTHVSIGGSILSRSQSPLLRLGEQIALSHHERWDGTGYPAGLGGEEIPVTGRIVAVADVFDALTHDRPYKEAWPVDEAVAEIGRQSGRQFDPGVVEAFGALDHAALLASPAAGGQDSTQIPAREADRLVAVPDLERRIAAGSDLQLTAAEGS